jgi:hypothetical protein
MPRRPLRRPQPRRLPRPAERRRHPRMRPRRLLLRARPRPRRPPPSPARHGNRRPSRVPSKAATGELPQARDVPRLAAMAAEAVAVLRGVLGMPHGLLAPTAAPLLPRNSRPSLPPASRRRRPRPRMPMAGPRLRPQSRAAVGRATARSLPEHTNNALHDSRSPLYQEPQGSTLTLAGSPAFATLTTHLSSFASLHSFLHPSAVVSLAWIAQQQRYRIQAEFSFLPFGTR